MARAVYDVDRYPVALPTDLGAFLFSPDAYGAWEAEGAGEILGHVALHPRSSAAVVALASDALGRPPDRLGVVARLLVAPWARRRGAGRALLDVASRDAVTRGLWPVLDVATSLHTAIGMYEQCGWTRVGEVTVRVDDELSVDEFVYVGPHSPEATS